MKVSVLVENATPSSRFAARHGLSLFLEVDAAFCQKPVRVLFDMGPDDAFLANARALGMDVRSADAAVVSHGHYDHGGGLGAYLTHTADLPTPVYVRAGAFEGHASGSGARRHSNGLDRRLARNPRVVEVDSGQRCALAPGLTLFSCACRPHAEPAGNARLFERRGGAWEPDRFTHEQGLLVRERGRVLLVSSCSHAGILNIMDEAERIAGAPLDVVMGGFHLTSPSAGTGEDAAAVRALACELVARRARYYTFHCTGLPAFSVLRDVLGDRVSYLTCGVHAEV